MAAAVQVIQDPEAAATVLHPERRRLLELLQAPDSASGLARRLQLPRQQVNYHIQQLERDSFLELVEERRKGNCTERVLRATARSYLISPAVLGQLGSEPVEARERFSSAYLVALGARTVREVATLRRRAELAGKRLATLALETEVRFASAESRTAFAEELATELARLAAKYDNTDAPGGRSFRFTVGGYPTITRTADDDQQAVRMD